jgi:hypothetical protein
VFPRWRRRTATHQANIDSVIRENLLYVSIPRAVGLDPGELLCSASYGVDATFHDRGWLRLHWQVCVYASY